ncbi:hypothetical protein HBN50_11950 [Halobacteriovorax sp. GB3]|uniref:hypothetical protein n=1 Tax=Halobacteriovorax sp. GB3 TaxID=2719615 RepID=UPI0023627100|nr:hypothetical protein [Halobacteriovorax sp. GB3]MDD0853814.1 hypothetical protein [Halobacteriovorax sp. GB3]
MKVNDIKKRITSFSTELYPFAYALIPDDLQAQQLIVDGIAFLFADRDSKARLINLVEVEDFEMSQKEIYEIKKVVMKVIYGLATKRFIQLQPTLNFGEHGAFYALEAKQRAVLFLMQKFGLDSQEVASIINLTKLEVTTLYFDSKNKLSGFLGTKEGANLYGHAIQHN